VRGEFSSVIVNVSHGGAATAFLSAIDLAAYRRADATPDASAGLYKIDHLSFSVMAVQLLQKTVLVTSRDTPPGTKLPWRPIQSMFAMDLAAPLSTGGDGVTPDN
jgi:hypothetical protein